MNYELKNKTVYSKPDLVIILNYELYTFRRIYINNQIKSMS